MSAVSIMQALVSTLVHQLALPLHGPSASSCAKLLVDVHDSEHNTCCCDSTFPISSMLSWHHLLNNELVHHQALMCQGLWLIVRTEHLTILMLSAVLRFASHSRLFREMHIYIYIHSNRFSTPNRLCSSCDCVACSDYVL
jgi:hypothetical protein